MIRNSIEVANLVSPTLSALIESQINDYYIEEPVTLASIRDYASSLLPSTFIETEKLHHFDMNNSLIDELNALIDEYGEAAFAIDFVQSVASEQLSRLIEIIVGDDSRENPPTLNTVRDAILAGLSAKLVGNGVLEEDEDDTLLAEIDTLIDRHGGNTLAEPFLRYE